jgi:RNA polymerase sigma-70 factor (ECF subfamily)
VDGSGEESATGVEGRQTPEIQLVRRAAEGEVAAYESLYRAHVGRVRALCLRMCRDRSEADELVQDVFVRVWERLGSFRGDSAFGTWLHRVAANTVIESLRAKGRWRERMAAAVDPAEVPDAAFQQLAGMDLDLERAIAGLPPRARMVFVLHDVLGHTHREIAEMTGTATGTSKAHLHRARSLLRAALTRGPEKLESEPVEQWREKRR